LINDTWKSDDAVANWFKLVNNERTIKNYKWEFPKFLEYINSQPELSGIAPKDIVQQRLEQLTTTDMGKRRFWENRFVEYKHTLEDSNLKKNTIKSYLRTVQSFFSYNNGKLVLTRNDTKITPKNHEDRVPTEWIPSNEDVRLLFRLAKEARDRSILLMLYQSGFSEADVGGMQIEDFPFYDENGRWRLVNNEDLYHARLREKTNILQQTCISREALEEIRIMLQSRGFPTSGYLFVSFRKEPLGVRGINDAMKEIVKRAFNGKAKEWQTKHLRDAYMNGLLQAKLPQEVKDSMVGHQRQGARKEYALTEQTIRVSYETAFEFLTINSYGSQNILIEELQKKQEEDRKNLEAKMNEDRDALMAIVKDLQKQAKEQASKLMLLNARYAAMQAYIKEPFDLEAIECTTE
jgi:site-specific recombinase XerD